MEENSPNDSELLSDSGSLDHPLVCASPMIIGWDDELEASLGADPFAEEVDIHAIDGAGHQSYRAM
jgi:hypothetical protein